MEGTKNKSMFPLVGGIVLIIVLAAFAWFMFYGKQEGTIVPEVIPTAQEPDAATAALNTQSTSDELSDIDSDIGATDLSALNDVDKI